MQHVVGGADDFVPVADNPSLARNAKLLGESMSKENGAESAIRAIENAFM